MRPGSLLLALVGISAAAAGGSSCCVQKPLAANLAHHGDEPKTAIEEEGRVALSLKQVKAEPQSAVALEVTITNLLKDQAVWLNASPSIGTCPEGQVGGELDICLRDHMQRRIPRLCSEDVDRLEAPKFVALPPSGTHVFHVLLTKDCFRFYRGESIRAEARYTPMKSWLDPPAGVYSLQGAIEAPDWINVIAPFTGEDDAPRN